jgi:glycopeptide antibiotics resistance protein
MLKSQWSFTKKVLATVALTLAFEITQFIFAIGRADITDVLSNTLGGVIGIGVYALLFKLMKGKTNKVLNVLATVLTAFSNIVCRLAIGKSPMGAYQIDMMLYKIQQAGAGRLLPD